eukprot:662844-Rhodomonas_salina.2
MVQGSSHSGLSLSLPLLSPPAALPAPPAPPASLALAPPRSSIFARSTEVPQDASRAGRREAGRYIAWKINEAGRQGGREIADRQSGGQAWREEGEGVGYEKV